MFIRQTIAILLAAALLLPSCRKPIEGAAPSIEIKSISKYTMRQNGQDSLLLELDFADNDGDIGDDVVQTLFISDSRTDSLLATYLVPRISSSDRLRRAKGSISVFVYSGCCKYSDGTSCYPNPNSPTDTIRYKVQLQDRAGNLSNSIMSDKINLTCQ
jgi:hypothetical protein